MEKTIKFGKEEYRLHSSVYSIIEYKNVFGVELFEDLEKIDISNDKNLKSNFSTIINTVLKLFYILHKPFTDKSYKAFLMGVDFHYIANPDELQTLASTIAEMLNVVKTTLPSYAR